MDDLISPEAWEAASEPCPGVPMLCVVYAPEFGSVAALTLDGQITGTGADRG